MKIESTYQTNSFITVSCLDFDPTDGICQNLQKMLLAKKFLPTADESTLTWRREEFNNQIKNESFDFWLEQVTNLCVKFKVNKPVEVTPTGLGLSKSFTTDIVALVEQINQLKEEVERLKKFDRTANETLRCLQEKLNSNSATQSTR